MSYELYLRRYDRSGELQKGFINPLWARYTDSVNTDDPLVFALQVDSAGALELEELDLVEVMIRNRELGIYDAERDFVSAFVGVLRDKQYSTDDNGETFLEFIAPQINHILRFRSIMFYAGVTNRSTFQEIRAETILKTLVRYNCTSDASLVNGRLRNGDLLPGMGYDISIATDWGGGNLVSANFKGGNLLDSLQKIADQGGGDFALSWQGANDYEFEFYPGQLGEDLSSGPNRVLFSLENNTIRNPRLISSGARATVAISAGQGHEELRSTNEVFGPDYALDYDLEIFVDSRNEKTDEGREYRGALKLDEKRYQERLTFDVLQTGNQFYSPITITGRKTYRAGDLVLAHYPEDQVRKITAIRVYWKNPNREDAFSVDVETREVVFDYGS